MEVVSVIMFLLILFHGVRSDLNQDRQECYDQLVGLSSCLSFVSGEAVAPAMTCCTKLRQEINQNQTKKCLCVLVKDRDDPGLGFKVNATLALILPSACHAPSHASECPGLLNLSPNSTDAQVFEQFAALSQEGNGTTVEGSSSSSARRKGGYVVWMFGRALHTFFTIYM